MYAYHILYYLCIYVCIYIYTSVSRQYEPPDHDKIQLAGWGACGGPNDGWHQWYHGLRRASMRMRTGMGDQPRLRAALDHLSIGVDGNYRFEQRPKLDDVFVLASFFISD